MSDSNARPDLTAEEAKIVGSRGDLVSEDRVSPRGRSRNVMLSLRIDREVFDALSRLAEGRGRTFSEVAREALRRFVWDQGSDDVYPVHSAVSVGVERKVSESRQLAWTDDDLRAALHQYEAACRRRQMREKAWRSYVDYARRFLDWRTGNYTPRGVLAGDRPVPRRAAATSDLRRQADQYAREVAAAGREQSTVDAYYRHAMFFVRWLEGDFEPGARLHGLR